MKKIQNLFFLVLTLFSLSYSRPSSATVGLLSGNAWLAIGGAAATTGGFAHFVKRFDRHEGIPGFIVFILGIVMLDGENGQEMAFSQVNKEEGQKIGLTEAERLSYNAELDQVNFMLEDVNATLSTMEKPRLEDSAKVWQDLKPMVSDLTFSAIQKISAKSFKK